MAARRVPDSATSNSSDNAALPDAQPPIPPTLRPPVVLKTKTPESQAAPPLVSDPGKQAAASDGPVAVERAQESAKVPSSGALPPSDTPPEEPIHAIAPLGDNDTNNPLRVAPAILAPNPSAFAPPTSETGNGNGDNSRETRAMMARAMPASAPSSESATVSTSESSASPPGSPVESLTSPPPPSATASAIPAASDLAHADGYEIVKVYYGTDRAPLDGVVLKTPAVRSYLLFAIIAAALFTAAVFVAFRRLRWRFLQTAYVGSMTATVFLAAVAGYAAVTGRLPGQASPLAKSTDTAYGDRRGTLALGSCEISIPKHHEVGELESPSMLRLEFTEDPMKHVVLMKVAPEAADDFYAELHDRVAKSKGNSALVFIHGYNFTFEDAARRTAQMAYDLKFDGVPLFFSWPSQGKLLDYAVDETNAAWTVAHLRQFLADVARRSGAKQVHLIAHSMGNRALTAALKDLAAGQSDVARPIFDQVLLTAPDIDADVFKTEIAPAITKMAERVTLYASSSDAALLLSKKLHGYPRAGEAGREIVVVPGMDTVDVTAVDTSLVGHSYYGDSGSVLSDVVEVLEDAKPADQRKWLRPEYLGVKKYWVFQR
jgi:esterase/lipase superfamily enzyme